MTESMLQYVVDSLQAIKGHWAEVADATGVPKRTIEKIAAGITGDPGVRKIELLASYFRRREAGAPSNTGPAEHEQIA
ncbi:MAG TPA: hypothetical protein VFX20_18280 [Steroidobacteraceae bacterium]|nr:hypothetical protein [Steroidobacteraceae bacterium]